MGILNWIVMNDMFWIYLTYTYSIILSGFCLYLARKNKHHIIFVILIIDFLVYMLFGNIPPMIPYLYLWFLLIRWGYRMIKKKKDNYP